MELPLTLQQKIVDFLISLPTIQDTNSQQAFIQSVGFDSQLLDKINFAASSDQFFKLLIPILLGYGKLKDGRHALEAVLEAAKGYVGQDRQKECDEILQALRDLKNGSQPPDSEASPQTNRIPFTNREDEIRTILSPLAAAYYAVHAPAGYGKTELLKQLDIRFHEYNWDCVYVSIGEQMTAIDLANTIAQELGIEDLFHQNIELPPELRIAGALKRQWSEPEKSEEGLVLLIDVENLSAFSVANEIVEKFIPAIQKSLNVLEIFSKKLKSFRMILAGRYISKNIKDGTLILKNFPLSTFDYSVVQSSVRESYLKQEDEQCIAQISAHLMYFTGGHPDCIVQILQRYGNSGLTPDDFVIHFEQVIQRIVTQTIRNISASIPQEVHKYYDTIKQLSVFRYLDTIILKHVMKTLTLPETIRNEHDFANKLTATYLITRSGRLIHNSITRRLLVMQLRKESQSPFPTQCQQARAIYAKRMQDVRVNEPERWIVEYLFQSLQQYADEITTAETRQHIRNIFFEQDVPEAVRLFIEERNIPSDALREEMDVLIQKMDNDWEFRFTVNYYLREQQYDEQPYRQLKDTIACTFHQKITQ